MAQNRMAEILGLCRRRLSRQGTGQPAPESAGL